MKWDFFKKTEKKIRDFFARHGYTCDGCGVEMFDYPHQRFCVECVQKLEPAGDNVCPKCGRKKVADGVCTDCKRNLPKFTRGYAPLVYRGEVAAMVNRLKNGNPRLALYFGEQMAAYISEKLLKDHAKDEWLIIPVPISKNKLIERGYNQSEHLAERVCDCLQALGYFVRLDTELLQKRKDTAPQKQMTYTERMENVSGAYHVHKRKECRDKHILLIDDVMTTGATSSECAARLLGAGAKEAHFLSIAALIERR